MRQSGLRQSGLRQSAKQRREAIDERRKPIGRAQGIAFDERSTKDAAESKLAAKIISWQKVHGRHDLPWQNTRDAYRIWLSEIMLQQTQVSTVLPYYTRFLQRFPGLESLAQAPLESVLELWSGLGYYSRARNLHSAARTIAL